MSLMEIAMYLPFIVGVLIVLFQEPVLEGYYICDYCNRTKPGPETQLQGVTSDKCRCCGRQMRRSWTPE